MRILTTGDKVLLIVMLVVGGALFFVVPGLMRPGAANVEIRMGETIVGRYSLDRDRIVVVTGPLGKTVVAIQAGSVSVVEAPCPGKHCMKVGAVDRRGGIIVCVPNRVVVRVGSGVPHDLDAVTQ